MSTPRRKLPSLRNWLIGIHGDLFTIDKEVGYFRYYEGDASLSQLEQLVLVLEDRRFLRHDGIDIWSAARELFKAITFRKHGGASTIDMQFVRTATGYKQRTVKRKLYEMLLSFIIQFRYSKLGILRSYLDCAFFGSGLIGVNKAARKLYNKPVADLSDNECAELAAMLVYPRPLVPKESWFLRIRKRADYGLRLRVRLQNSLQKNPSRE
jgi:membrane peptidoglycan carboxypeptidase